MSPFSALLISGVAEVTLKTPLYSTPPTMAASIRSLTVKGVIAFKSSVPVVASADVAI